MDDATAERLLRGAAPADRPELEPLALLLSQVHELGSSAPAPTPALAALLQDGFVPGAAATSRLPVPPRASRRSRLAAVAGLSLGLKVLTGTGVALAGVTTAAGAGVLPDAVQDRISGVVRTLTPFDLDPAPVSPAERPEQATTPASEPPASQEPVRTEPTPPAPAPTIEPPRATPAQEPAAPAPQRAATPPAPGSQQAPERPTPTAAPQERPAQSEPAQSEPAQRETAPATTPAPARTGEAATPQPQPDAPAAAPVAPGSDAAPAPATRR
jgi:hypothetical protein